MNQKICPNCKNSNSPDKSFCTNCGQMLAVSQPNDLPPTIFAGSPNAPGFIPPNQSNFSQQAPQFNQATAPAKKSNKGIWIALIAIVGILGVGVVGFGLLGVIIYYRNNRTVDYNTYNTNTYTTNTNRSTFPTSNSNTSTTTAPTSTSMSENDKYRIFYAAAKVNDQALTTKVSKRIGIIDDSGKPTAYYKTFITGMFTWAAKDAEFVKSIDSKEKGMSYIRAQMPDLVSSVDSPSNPAPNTASVGVINSKASNLVQPEYPATAKAVHAAGAVNVQVSVDEAGNVTEATAVSGHPLLKQASEQAARASKFNPTILSGKAVKVSGIIVYNFTA